MGRGQPREAPPEARAAQVKRRASSGPRQWIADVAPWLLEPAFATCIVGTAALAEACRRAGLKGPEWRDLDLAWALDVERGREVLERHGVFLPTTAANLERGTLAAKLRGRRVEITAFRDGDPDAPPRERILADLAVRDMTVGAVAWWLAEDRVLDPFEGVRHYAEHRIVPVGDPRERVAEHPVRHVRYYRRAHEWEFELDRSVRKLPADPALLGRIPPEALAQEVRMALLRCRSPGRFLMELHEARLLEVLLPEVNAQFDGRPAGPVRHHPEVGQALHMILALEWIVARTRDLDDADRAAVVTAVLCHDLGKGLTPRSRWPAHPGHEESGVPLVERLLARLPGLTDARGRRLALLVCRLHQKLRRLRDLRPGTLADLYEHHLRGQGLREELLALAVGADSGGRLGAEVEGENVARQVEADVRRLREICASVDARHLKERAGGDVDHFKALLHEARARELGRRFE